MATEIVISKDSVVSTNPNIIHQSGLLDLDTFEHYPKNPKILGFFKEMGWSEEAGTGVKNVTRYLNIYVRGAYYNPAKKSSAWRKIYFSA